ncbi:50S ribosome-binding GTPase [Gracilaria domingensis]|nr:50S ribosome-binding GTPase [Gracilaria domingensis]
MRIVVAGNPGVGKSAILNGMIGRARFKSGISIGEGMSQILQNVRVGGEVFYDTPGLDDLHFREQAAEEISKAFKGGGKFKLIFVVTLEAGRVRASDLAAIDTVLSAIQKVGTNTDHKYSVIVNKCEKEVLKKLENQEEQARLMIAFNRKNKVGHFGCMCIVPEAIGKSNYVLSTNHTQMYADFVSNAPTFDLRPDVNVVVNPELYEASLSSLERWVSQVYTNSLVQLGSIVGTVAGAATGCPELATFLGATGKVLGAAVYSSFKGLQYMFRNSSASAHRTT